MQNGIKVLIVGVVLGVGLSACQRDRDKRASDTSNTPSPTATAPSTTPPATTMPAMTNSDLENAVKAKLQSDDSLKAAKINVNADADKKEVTLSGTVASQDLRTRAVDLAKSAQSGVTVNDKIDVKPAA